MDQLQLFPSAPMDAGGVCPHMDDTELTVSYADLARRHGVTTRAIRRWVQEGDLEPPTVVRLAGTGVTIRRWSASILVRSDFVAARRRDR